MSQRAKVRSLWIALALLPACGENPAGDVQVVVTPQPIIAVGIEPGNDRGQIVDGWSVRFDKFVVALGDLRIARDEGDLARVSETATLVDLRRIPTDGVALERFSNMDAVRWEFVSYATPVPTAAVERDKSVSANDAATMVANGWTHWIEGTLQKEDGESCPPGGSCKPADVVRFVVQTSTPVRFDFCASPIGIPGVAVTEGGTTTAAISLNADHLFFNGFLSGHRQLEFRAQWIADADFNHDGMVDVDELARAAASDVLPPAPSGRYSYAGAPKPIETALDYAESQLATFGHFDGEGECAWRLQEPQ